MPTKLTGRHEWLKQALAEHGHRQGDVAKAWGVDDAVVSRFIKSGEPELTWDRAQTLSSMLAMTLDELKLRLQEGMPPRAAAAASRRAAAPAPASSPPVADGDAAAAMKDLHAAAHRAIGALGINGVRLVLEFGAREDAAQ